MFIVMEINPNFVGTTLKEFKTRINWRQTTNYAAAVKDSNPFFLNDELKDGLVAHPMFPVAVTWPIIENLSEYIQNSDFPKNILSTGVHYSEHLIIHRLIKPRDKLIITGKIAAIIPHRAGTHFIGQFEALDRKGNPVFTQYTGTLLRGIKCIGEGKGIENISEIPKIDNNGIKMEKKMLWTHSENIDLVQTFIYDGCTDIVFPIHTSKKFAKMLKLPDIILQGTATLAFAVSAIIKRETQGNPNLIKEIYAKFTGMVFPGTTIQIKLKQRQIEGKVTHLFFEVLNHEGKRAISNGYIKTDQEIYKKFN